MAKRLRLIYILIILFVSVIPFFPLFLPVDDQNKWTASSTFSIINAFILVILIVDYCLRWITYPCRASKYSSFPLFFFPITGVSILMIFSLLPTLLSVFAKFIPEENPFVEFIRIFSIMRIIRLLMLLNVVPTFKIFSHIFQKNRVLLINVFLFVFIMAIIFALLFYSVEGGTEILNLEKPISNSEDFYQIYPQGLNVTINNKDVLITKDNFDLKIFPKEWLNESGTSLIKITVPINEKIRNIWDSIYFTFITITTIGYGDISPLTSMGRVVVIIDAILGIIIFSIPSGIITGSFIVEAQEMYKNKTHSNKQKEINKLSFAEKIYYNTKTKTRLLFNNGKAKESQKPTTIITIEQINSSSFLFEKIIHHIDDDNIFKIDVEKDKILIYIFDIRAINDDFYNLCNLLDLSVKVNDLSEDYNNENRA